MGPDRRLLGRVVGTVAVLAMGLAACDPHVAVTSISRRIASSVVDARARFDGAHVVKRQAGTGEPGPTYRHERAQPELEKVGATLTPTRRSDGASKSSDHRRGVEVVGSWQQIGTVLIPVGVEGDVARFRFRGLCTVQGGWIGVFKQAGVLNVDLVTGDSWGTSIQIFTGRAADGGIGSITIDEDFTIAASPTMSLHGVARIVGGTGDFARSSGSFEDYGVTSLVGTGGYTAHWVRP